MPRGPAEVQTGAVVALGVAALGNAGLPRVGIG